MIVFSEHALSRMELRGATRHEVRQTVREGASSPAREGRTKFRHTFDFQGEWRGARYEHKELSVFAVREGGNWIIVTVITRYF